MALATKDPRLKARSREIYATDAEWAEVKAAAAVADMKISRYLLSGRRLAPTGSAQEIAKLLALGRASRATRNRREHSGNLPGSGVVSFPSCER